MASKAKRSIEEQVEDIAKKQLSEVKYFTKTEMINSEIETALKTAPSKSGGSGANIPDIKLFLETEGMRRIPVMIEVKGKKGDFIKLTSEGEIDNKKKDGTENFTNINKYAVNGAVHYANAIVKHTASYKEAIAIAAKQKRLYIESIINEELIIPSSEQELKYCLSAIRGMERDEIIQHKDYILNVAYEIYSNYFNDKPFSSIKSDFRYMLCWIDEAMYMER